MARNARFEFVKTELELALAFVGVARTKYSMGNRVGGDATLEKAIKAYHEALRFSKKLSSEDSSIHKQLTALRTEVEAAIKTLHGTH
jgi:hypothetical protein